MNLNIYFNNINVTPWAEWPGAELEITKNDNFSLDLKLTNIKFVETAYTFILNNFPSKIDVYLYWDGLEFKGTIYPGDISFYKDYVVADLNLSPVDIFTRRVEGRLLPDNLFVKIPVVISPRTNAQGILTLIVSTFNLTYIITKELFDIQKELAIILGISGAGATGPISASATQIAILALRAAYVAALVVALIKLIEELFNYIERIKYVAGCNLYEALEHFATIAGLSLQAPIWLKDVWLVGGDKTEYEAGELFLLAKQLTNSYIFINNGTLFFVSNTSSFPAIYQRAYIDKFKYNYNDIARKEIISFLRDTADDHCLDEFAAVEITRNINFKGYSRLDIPLAPARVAGDRPILQFVSGFLQVLGIFSQNIANISATYKNSYGYIIVEREIFTKKIIFSSNFNNINPLHIKNLLNKIASYYTNNRILKIYNDVILPLKINEIFDLLAQGFPGVISMRWSPITQKAVVTYQEAVGNLPDNYEII